MSLKLRLYRQCQNMLKERLVVVRKTISDIQAALESETKSSAGDKHETGRAMLQIEREKAGQQLAEIQKQFDILNKINPKIEQSTIALGSIVYTTKSNYFLGISAGELRAGEDTFFAVSMATPIAKLLLSKSEGETVRFRDEELTITKIL